MPQAAWINKPLLIRNLRRVSIPDPLFILPGPLDKPARHSPIAPSEARSEQSADPFTHERAHERSHVGKRCRVRQSLPADRRRMTSKDRKHPAGYQSHSPLALHETTVEQRASQLHDVSRVDHASRATVHNPR